MRFKLLIFLSVFSLCCVVKLSGQGNLLYVDDKPIRFGFTLGINAMHFNIKESFTEIDRKIYHAGVSQLSPGFSVGVSTDLRLHEYWNLRFVPALHFGERKISYRAQGDEIISSLSIASIPVSIPVYLKYSAKRLHNYRPYLIGGIGASIDLGRDKENPVLLKPLDFYMEFGAGCDLYFPFFKLSPELKFAIGFNDMFTPLEDRNAGFISEENKMYSNALSRLTSRMLTLTFNFE
ncbi:MAG: PorT family protein [Prevotellaceae bacterium]|jgi:hypothetical protein|nr:PorT family protein [Prevotellaceae bacterium]